VLRMQTDYGFNPKHDLLHDPYFGLELARASAEKSVQALGLYDQSTY